MKNFGRLPGGISFISLGTMLYGLKKKDMWGFTEFDKLRSSNEISPHAEAEVESITLRNNEFPHLDGMLCEWTEALQVFPEFLDTIYDVARLVQADAIGRVIITKLPPSGIIKPHIDIGEYCAAYNRFHVCLQSENSTFDCGDEGVEMRQGEVWWMNNKITHSVVNRSETIDRIHLIIDLKTRN